MLLQMNERKKNIVQRDSHIQYAITQLFLDCTFENICIIGQTIIQFLSEYLKTSTTTTTTTSIFLTRNKLWPNIETEQYNNYNNKTIMFLYFISFVHFGIRKDALFIYLFWFIYLQNVRFIIHMTKGERIQQRFMRNKG